MKLMEKLIQDKKNYVHVANLISGSHKFLLNTENSLLVYFEEPDVFIAETTLQNQDELITKIKKENPLRIETTSKNLFNKIKGNFLESYECFQFSLENHFQKDENLQYLKSSDVDFVISTYGMEIYVRQLFKKNRLLGYYENSVLKGYVAKHIDGSLGALYVKPEFRRCGYGKKILLSAASFFSDENFYTQVLTQNKKSVKLHESLNLVKSEKIICWAFNKDFCFKDI